MAELELVMIVRDEAEWIEPCLVSAIELGIDAYLIADTGSEDDTVEVAGAALEGIPGAIIELPWEGHAKTRTELLRRAHGTAGYLLQLDADMTLEGELPAELVDDVYDGTIRGDHSHYSLPIILKGDRHWEYRGAAHPYLAAQDKGGEWTSSDSGLTIVDRRPGGFREGKFEEDARLLEAALELDPNDARSCFYLAQTYQSLDRPEDAIRTYGQRGLLGGWAEERFVAKLRRARLLQKRDQRAALHGFLDAHDERPTRAEALYGAARLCRIGELLHVGLVLAREAAAIELPAGDRLFVEHYVYEWGARFELAFAELKVGDVARGRQSLEDIRAEGKAPEAWLDWIDQILGGPE